MDRKARKRGLASPGGRGKHARLAAAAAADDDEDENHAAQLRQLKYQKMHMMKRMKKKTSEIATLNRQLEQRQSLTMTCGALHRAWITLGSDLRVILERLEANAAALGRKGPGKSVEGEVSIEATDKQGAKQKRKKKEAVATLSFLQLLLTVDEESHREKGRGRAVRNDVQGDEDSVVGHLLTSLRTQVQTTHGVLAKVVTAMEVSGLDEPATDKDPAVNTKLTQFQQRIDELTIKLRKETVRCGKVEDKLSVLEAKARDADNSAHEAQTRVALLTEKLATINETPRSGPKRKLTDADRDEHEENKILCESRLAEIVKLQKVVEELTVKLANLESRHTVLPPDAVAESVLYRTLKHEHSGLREQWALKQHESEEFQRALADCEAARRKDQESFAEADSRHMEHVRRKEAEFNARVHKLMAELAACRRKEKKAQVEDQLMDDVKNRLAHLEEANRIKDRDLAKLRESAKVQETEQLDSRDKRLLFRSHRAKEVKWKEEKLALERMLDIFKTSSQDSRELAEVRTSEKQLREEVAKLKKAKRGHTKSGGAATDNDTTAQPVEELEEELETEKEVSGELTAELDEMANNYSQLQDQNSSLLAQTKKQELSKAKLASERIKASQMLLLFKRERDLMETKVMACIDKNKRQDILIGEAQARSQTLSHQVAKLQQRHRLAEEQLQTLRTRDRERNTVVDRLRGQMEDGKKVFQGTKQKMEEAVHLSEKRARKSRELRETIESLERKARRAKLKASKPVKSTVDSGLEAELRLVKARLQCSVCSDRPKSVVITKCFHLFCAQCIDNNLKVRLRKCPGCGTGFGAADVHPVYLT